MINYIRNSFLEESERWVLWLPVFFGVGIGIYFGLADEPSGELCYALPVLPLALLIIFRKNLGVRLVMIALLVASLGFLNAKLSAVNAAAPIINELNYPVTISGNIESISNSSGFPAMTLDKLRIDEIDQQYLPEKIHLNVRTKFKEPVKPGDRIITTAKLYPPGRPAIPGGYDFAKFAYFDGVGANGFAVRRIIKLKKGGEDDYLAKLRFKISERIRAAVPGDDGAMCDAIITGDRSHISKEAYDNMRKSGLAHLIAVSGINLVLAAGVIFFSVRLIMSVLPISEVYSSKKIAAFFAIFANFIYIFLCGLQVPAVRSFIMITIVMLGILFSRQASPMRGLVVSALLVLIFIPESLLTPSFQLTYAATLALISVFEIFKRNTEGDEFSDSGKIVWYKKLANKIWLYPATVLGSSLVAGLATAPYSAFHFNQFVNYGLLANLFAIPLTSVIVMPFAVLGMLLMPFGLEKIGLVPMGWGNHWTFDIAEWVTNLKGSYVHVPQISVWGLCLITLGGLWFLLWQTKWRYFGFVVIAVGLSSMLLAKVPDVIVAENGKLFAMRYDGKLYLSNLRNSFASKNWLQSFAQGERLKLEKAESYEVKGYTFKQVSPLSERGNIFLEGGVGVGKAANSSASENPPQPLPQGGEINHCAFVLMKDNTQKLCVTADDLKNKGAHSIYFTDNKIVVETVEERRGKRLWTNNQIEQDDE